MYTVFTSIGREAHEGEGGKARASLSVRCNHEQTNKRGEGKEDQVLVEFEGMRESRGWGVCV